MDFGVDLDHAHGCAVLAVAGELDIATAPELEAVLGEAEAAAVPIVVDLSATSFCDSTGMTAVLRAAKRAEARDRPFAVVCPASNRDVLRVLRLLGFDAAMAVHAGRGEAVDDVRRRAAAGT